MKNEKAKTIAGDISAPVYLYLGESGGGSDRRIKLEGSTLFDKLLNLRKARTYVSIGPAADSREWSKLDPEDQEYYKELQTKAKKLKTYKAMGDFLNQLCSNNECMLFAIRQGDDAVWVNPHILKELLDTPWHGIDSVWLSQAADVKGYWDKVIAARDAGKDYSKIKPENRNEGHGSELLTVVDVVELADSITKEGRPFYIDTDHEVENGLDVWAVDSKTGEDYPRSWRVMNDLSVLVFNTDRRGDTDLVDEKSFEDIRELGAWLANEFNSLAGKGTGVREAGPSEDTKDLYPEFEESDVCYPMTENGKIYIGMDLLKDALKKGGAPGKFVDSAKYDINFLNKEGVADPIGVAHIKSWGTYPDDNGWRSTIDMNVPDRDMNARYFLILLVEGMLDAIDGGKEFAAYGAYDEDAVPHIMAEINANEKIRAKMSELGLDMDGMLALVKAPLKASGYDALDDELFALDGKIEEN